MASDKTALEVDEQRYCSQCGELTVKKAHKLYVCSNNHENWINPLPGASVFILKDDKVLYGVRSIEPSIGRLTPPGGFIDPGENGKQAAVREAKEEAGVDIAPHTILGTYTSTYFGKPSVGIVYVADYIGGEPTGGDDMNGGNIVWRNINDLPTADELAWDWHLAAQADLVQWWAARQTGV